MAVLALGARVPPVLLGAGWMRVNTGRDGVGRLVRNLLSCACDAPLPSNAPHCFLHCLINP